MVLLVMFNLKGIRKRFGFYCSLEDFFLSDSLRGLPSIWPSWSRGTVRSWAVLIDVAVAEASEVTISGIFTGVTSTTVSP